MISVMTIISGLVSLVPITGICVNEKTALLLDSYERDVKPLVIEYSEREVQVNEGEDIHSVDIPFKSTQMTTPPPPPPVPVQRKQRPDISREVKDLADLNSIDDLADLDLTGIDEPATTKKVGASPDLDILNSDLNDILNG